MLSCTANADDISTSLAKTVPSVYDSQQEEMLSMKVFLLLHYLCKQSDERTNDE